MRNSIRRKASIIIIAAILTSVLLFILINAYGLERVYISKKQQSIYSAYTYLKSAMETEDLDSESFLRNLQARCEVANMTIMLRDPSGRLVYSSAKSAENQNRRLEAYILDRNSGIEEVLREEDGFWLVRAYDDFTQMEYLECYGYYPDGTFFIVSTALESVSQIAKLTNRFMLLVGSVIAVLSGVAVHFMAKRMTRPIRELSELSKKMSNLDFTARYEGTSSDELGVLGSNMNEMASTLEQTIRQLQKDIDQKTQIDEMRKEFISNVSHELKTPIALIQGYAEGLQEGVSDDPESREYYCSVIVDEAQRMNKLVRKLLELTQLEFAQTEADYDVFDLAEAARGILESSRLMLEEAGAHVSFEAEEPALVSADEFMAEQVIRNYYDNAVHHLTGEKEIVIGSSAQARTIV